MHKARGNFIYLKQILTQLHILRFQKGRAISRYEAQKTVLCSSVETRHSYLVPRAVLRKMTQRNYPIGSKMNSDCPLRTQVCPLISLHAWIRVKNSPFSHNKNKVKKKTSTTNMVTEPAITYCPQMQTAKLSRISFPECKRRGEI